MIVDNYIVRIYRRDEKSDNGVIGLVERVEKQEMLSFKSMEELIGILRDASPDAAGSAEPGMPPRNGAVRLGTKNGARLR
jgi:hypothetical protein